MSDGEARAKTLLGLTVVAQIGDGELIGRIVAVNHDSVQLQVGASWFESVAWECLRATRPAFTDQTRVEEES